MEPITDDLAELFPDTVTVEPCTEVDGFGRRQYNGTAFTVKANVCERTVMVRASDGQVRQSMVHATIKGSFGLTVKDRYTLPARFVPNKPEAVSVAGYSDENGPHHQVVYF